MILQHHLKGIPVVHHSYVLITSSKVVTVKKRKVPSVWLKPLDPTTELAPPQGKKGPDMDPCGTSSVLTYDQ